MTRATEKPDGATEVRELATSTPGWLADRRLAGWDAANALPWPSSQRDEDWRRTDISKLDWHAFAAENATDPTGLISELEAMAGDAPRVLTASARPSEVVGADHLIAEGVIVCSLDEAAARHPELVQRGLAAIPAGESVMLGLWNARWSGGCFVHVPAAVSASLPVWALSAAAGRGALMHSATVIVIDEGGSLTLNEVQASADSDEMFALAVTAISLGAGARLDYSLLQRLGDATWNMSLHRATLAADSSLRQVTAALGSHLSKSYWEAQLLGEGANASIAGLALARGRQHLDHQSLQAHVAPNTVSRMTLRTVVRDTARSVYGGLISVAASGQHADGYVQNRNLLLSPGARADSIPRLEIKANDVRCGHGATASHIDSDQRLYLQSRGIPEAAADRLIIRGFLDEILDMAADERFREAASVELDRVIAQGDQLA